MSSKSDLKAIRKMEKKAPANSALKRILTEVLAVSEKVSRYVEQDSSGYAVCFYDPRLGIPLTYQVNYQPGNTGNLVHELTHVACNEAYRQDFVNYPCFHSPTTEPAYDGAGRRSNEAQRQDEWRDAAGAGRKQILQGLKAQARGLDFGSVRVKKTFEDSSGNKMTLKVDESLTDQVVNKLDYGISKPHIEFDTVVNQILVWLTEWGYPTKSDNPNMAFYYAIENAVKIAWHQRRAGAPRLAQMKDAPAPAPELVD